MCVSVCDRWRRPKLRLEALGQRRKPQTVKSDVEVDAQLKQAFDAFDLQLSSACACGGRDTGAGHSCFEVPQLSKKFLANTFGGKLAVEHKRKELKAATDAGEYDALAGLANELKAETRRGGFHLGLVTGPSGSGLCGGDHGWLAARWLAVEKRNYPRPRPGDGVGRAT